MQKIRYQLGDINVAMERIKEKNKNRIIYGVINGFLYPFLLFFLVKECDQNLLFFMQSIHCWTRI